MKVKIGNNIYDAELQPVMVILEGNDKANIAAMTSDATKYCSYPDDMDSEEVLKWMREIPEDRKLKRPKPTPTIGY